MSASNIRKNFLYNSFYQILALLLPLITTPYISRILGADGIGEYAYHFSVAKYFVLFAMLGLNNYGNRTIAAVQNDKQKLSKTFSSIYCMQLFFSLAIIGLYVLYILVFHEGKMAIILTLFVFSSALDINWFFFGIEKFKLTVIRNTIVKLASVACIFLFVREQKDIYIYGFIMALSLALSQVLVWPYIRRFIKIVRPSKEEVLAHIKPNLILFLPVIAVSLYKLMDKIMLGKMSGLTEVGYYQNAEKVIEIPEALVMALGTVMLPRMSNLVATNKTAEGKRYIYYSILFAAFLSTSIGFGIAGISPEFVPWFFGKGFEPCVYIFVILAPSTIFIALANVLRTQYLIPMHKDRIYVYSVFIGAIVNIVLNTILIPWYKSSGAAIGTLVAEGTVCVYQYVKVRGAYDFCKPIRRSAPFFIAGVGMFIVIKVLSLPFNSLLTCIIIKSIIGAAVYLFISCSTLVVRRVIFKRESIFPDGIVQLIKRR